MGGSAGVGRFGFGFGFGVGSCSHLHSTLFWLGSPETCPVAPKRQYTTWPSGLPLPLYSTILDFSCALLIIPLQGLPLRCFPEPDLPFSTGYSK
jgi:hypothetical protein